MRRKRRSKAARKSYVLNYTIGNVSKRTTETREAVKKWLSKSLTSATQCPFCLEPLRLGFNVAVDHKIPIARGGTRLLSNCWPTCQKCNRAKGDLTVEEFQSLRTALLALGPYVFKSVLARLKMAGALFK